MANTLPVPPLLIVEDGLHRAARARLSTGRHHIGTAPDSDIVVTDLGPAGTRFALEVDASAITLHALATPIVLPRGKSLRPGRSARCGNDLRFRCGAVSFRIEAPAARLRVAGRRNASFAWSLPALAVAGILAALLSVLTLSNTTSKAEAPALSADVTGPVPVGAQTAAVVPPASAPFLAKRPAGSADPRADALKQRLADYLANAGLASIVVKVQPEGSIEAVGQIAPQQTGAWRQAGQWFDGEAAGQLVLVDRVRVAVEPPPLTIQAVWPGRRPYVVDGSGDKLFAGSVLANGWTVSGIETERVILKRGDQVLAVRF